MYGRWYSSYKPTFFTLTPDVEDNKIKLKKENVGIFNPYIDNLDCIGMIESRISIIYMDIFIFKKRLLFFVINNPKNIICK